MTLLAVDLKDSTKVIHMMAERSKFVRHFFRGEITSEVYNVYLISLYHVYSALEIVLEKNKNNANIDLVYFPEHLSRVKAIEEDLEFYNGSEWRTMLTTVSPALKSYIDAIKRCDATKPELLIAHCYVRYLGDLSGGQILSKKLQKHNNLPEGKGVSFYTFNKIEDKEAFKTLYRKRLNQVVVDVVTYNEIIEESQKAFVEIIDIFEELDTLLDNSLDSSTERGPLLCPFIMMKEQNNQTEKGQVNLTEAIIRRSAYTSSTISPKFIRAVVTGVLLKLLALAIPYFKNKFAILS